MLVGVGVGAVSDQLQALIWRYVDFHDQKTELITERTY